MQDRENNIKTKLPTEIRWETKYVYACAYVHVFLCVTTPKQRATSW